MNASTPGVARWSKYNLVGAAGSAVQLGTLALIQHISPRHYLLATAAAIEITLMHNFVWHLRFTWRDRFPSTRCAVASQLLRFHLANGLVSIVGNLALMPLLVESARLPVIIANTLAILCCSMVNFMLGDKWAFA